VLIFEGNGNLVRTSFFCSVVDFLCSISVIMGSGWDLFTRWSSDDNWEVVASAWDSAISSVTGFDGELGFNSGFAS